MVMKSAWAIFLYRHCGPDFTATIPHRLCYFMPTIARKVQKCWLSSAAADWPVHVAGKRPHTSWRPPWRIMQASWSSLWPQPHPAARAGLVSSLRPAYDALALVQRVACQHQMEISSCTDDRIFNDWSLLHAREGYDDRVSSAQHVVRPWLHDPKLRCKLPGTLRWGSERSKC
ncbi:uncharacterized protein B0I36DRAFT_55770 [Microdochium trichocladiopsis]|uniref:TauD/TfdA-like domain-containing protein n=1 Tax=Microdochium trichocladiopsis TaxID=1682393 RepID=A0A9P8XQF1_9PEZI|nr:uncharacterized protein B0I36DRAFT_55770 [Microdochium trichocladiopsis]KAH7010797.1 hypothetical protein B0I36DRAFT_55770 [Microdochium trichocladiopsis]